MGPSRLERLATEVVPVLFRGSIMYGFIPYTNIRKINSPDMIPIEHFYDHFRRAISNSREDTPVNLFRTLLQ